MTSSSTSLKLFRAWTEYSQAFLEYSTSGLWPFLRVRVLPLKPHEHSLCCSHFSQCFCRLLGFCASLNFCRMPCCSVDSIGFLNSWLQTLCILPTNQSQRPEDHGQVYLRDRRALRLTVSWFQWNPIHHSEEGLDYFVVAVVWGRVSSCGGQPGSKGSRTRYNLHRLTDPS